MIIQECDVYVFLGPSLSHEKAINILPNVNYLPPIKCGDIFSILRYRPRLIAIIDGYFEHTAAVWHKEILQAIKQEIIVFGASSMGALRAAELHSFGMSGVGKIFEMYRDGIIEDDDEVALLHGPADVKYLPLSEPFVNIRTTLTKAIEEKIISSEEANILIVLGKNKYYKERNLQKIIEQAQTNHSICENKASQLRNWLIKNGIIDQKANDAAALLNLIKNEYIGLSKIKCDETKIFNTSMFSRALQQKIDCEVNTRNSINNSWHEMVVKETNKNSQLTKILSRYSYLLSIVFYINTTNFGLATDWDQLKMKFNDEWQNAQDCDTKFMSAFLTRVKIIYNKSGIQTNFINDEIKNTLINLFKLSGQYPLLNQNFKDSASNLKQLQSLEQQLGNSWSIHLDIAKLWHIVFQRLKQLQLFPSDITVERYIEKFYQQRKIFDEATLQQWLNDNELSSEDFNQLMQMASSFDYVIGRSNLDLLEINYPHDAIWWYQDALLLSGLYPKTREKITASTKPAHNF